VINKKTRQIEFSSQPYPLYAWGLWADPIYDGSFEKIERTEYHKDRLTIIGWQTSGRRVEPIVASRDYGPIPLREFSGNWVDLPMCLDDYEPWLDEEGGPAMVGNKFVLVEISMTEPDDEVFQAAIKFNEFLTSFN